MAEELTAGFLTIDPLPLRRSRPGPAMDYSHRFDREGHPKRPLDDAMTARHMMRRGFTEGDVRHVLGYLPDPEELSEGPKP